MASTTRDDLLVAVEAFKTAVDDPVVRAGDAVGDLLRRGLTVSGFNLLETFIAGRMGEIASHVNSGSSQFVDLPDALQVRAIKNTISVASGRVRRMGREPATLRAFARSLGASLSAVDRTLELSPLTWMWSGSNMASDDYHQILRAFHVKDPWVTANAIATRMGYGSLDLRVAIDDLARERHKCAHEARHGVTALWLRSVPERVTAAAACFDVLASIAAAQLRTGSQAFFKNTDAIDGTSLQFRRVVDRGRDSAEMLEGARRAYRTDRDASALFSAAAGRCTDREAVIAQSATGDLTRWAVPAIG